MLVPKESLNDLNGDFLTTVTKIESLLPEGVSYRVTSAKRDVTQNQAVGGVRDSAHEAGLALDVAHDGDIIKAMQLAYALGRAQVIRCGWYDAHIHFDVDKTKPQGQWTGKSH